MTEMQNGPDCVPCPTCGKPVEWTQQQCWRPFCSERCKLIDLGSWLDESHRVPGEAPSVLPDEQDFPNHSE